MKQKILIIVLCITGPPFLLNAQKTSYEFSAGISSAFYGSDAYYTGDVVSREISGLKTGFTGGLAVNFKTGKRWGIQPGLSYVQKGGTKKEADYDADVKYSTTLNYIELPVSMIYSKRDRFFFSFGLFGAYGMSGKMKVKGLDDEVKIDFGDRPHELKPFDAGINLLIGYWLPSKIFFSINFNSSFNNISNDDQNYLRNAYTGIKIGYWFSNHKTSK